MLQTDLTIIIVILNSLTFFGLGYWLGSKEKKTSIAIMDDWKDAEVIIDKVGKTEYQTAPNNTQVFDEPSGVVYRPTAQELKKMNEEESVKQEKEAVAALFKQGAVT